MLTATKLKLAAIAALGIGITACSSSSSPATSDTKHDGGSSDTDSGGGGGTMTLNDFCESLLTALSNVESKCEGGSAADWEAQNNASGFNTCSALAAAETAGRVMFDGSQAAACVAAYNSLTCDSLSSGSSTEPSACTATLSGTVATGGTCYSDDDCAGTTSHCEITSTGSTQSCTGKCAALLAPGAKCTATNDSCQTGYQCAAKAGSTTETCTAIPNGKTAAAGGTCGFDSTTMVTTTCDSGLVCNETTLKCIAQVAVGGSCAAYAYACVPFSYCGGTDKKCTAGAASGAACGFISDTEVQCAAGFTCKQAENATMGTCGTQAGSGAACTGNQDCVSGTCGTDKKCTDACTEL